MYRLPASSMRIFGLIALLALLSGPSVLAQAPDCEAAANPISKLQRSWLPVPDWAMNSNPAISQEQTLTPAADKGAKDKGGQTSFSSCYDECYWASLTCPSQCGATPSECAAATQVCYDSCNQGVGPWLPC